MKALIIVSPRVYDQLRGLAGLEDYVVESNIWMDDRYAYIYANEAREPGVAVAPNEIYVRDILELIRSSKPTKPEFEYEWVD